MKHETPFYLLLLLAGLLGGCINTGRARAEKTNGDEGALLEACHIRCRDPFIYLHNPTGTYYLHVNGGGKVVYYTSEDLEEWKFCGDSFIPAEDFWGENDFWAPDLYEYRGKYYIFITLSAADKKRGTSILVSDSPAGPFAPLVNGPVTPAGQMCLDGALHIDKEGSPWIIYCHEWLEALDGQVCALRLTDDLRSAVGEPIVLFRASGAPWVGDITVPHGISSVTGKVTDAPFIQTLEDGKMVMLWSSFTKDRGKYAIGQAFSDGELQGPWAQSAKPLNNDHGGHAMLFRDRNGNLMISYHAPNDASSRLTIKRAYVNDGQLLVDNL